MTFRTYAGTVSELLDRRAQKKAQTREQVRGIAHRLFGERGYDHVTIADVARQADVAVQTVFNHFTTKEELFFDGRVPWVDGPAQAVRSRPPSVPPLTALRNHLVELVGSLVRSMSTPERRCYVRTLEASETLRAYEGELVIETQRRLTVALLEAWTDGAAAGTHPAPADPAMAASLTAAVWVSAAKVLVLEQRPRVNAGASPEELAVRVEALAAKVLGQFEANAALTQGAVTAEQPAHTGWPQPAQQAG
jgi:AcrR family transcriptional regulator